MPGMHPNYLIFGQLTREYLLPPSGPARLDVAGGSPLYAAAGFRVWESGIGLVGRVGSDYPREWLEACETRGIDPSGIKVLDRPIDVREFFSYTESFELSRINPVSQFARREMTFPKFLLGYQPDKPFNESLRLLINDIPNEYLNARAAYLCPMELMTQAQMIAGLKRGTTHTLIVDPATATMTPTVRRELPLLHGITALLASQEEMRNLFQAETHDLWEMAEALSLYGIEYIVIKCGERGQLLFIASNKKKCEIPAYPARLADPTGAGDAFGGGFMAGFCKNYDPLEGALYGNVSASLKLEGSGAFYPLDVMPGLAQARLNALKDMVREV
jgi:sugar/nucleoside kinase (ribokinase family)